MSEPRLKDKVILLTGIAGGMGRVTARLFAQHGAIVVGTDLHLEGAKETQRLVESDGYRMDIAAPVDLADREQVTAWINGAVERHGRIDVLYNNASSPKFAPFDVMTDEDFRFTMVNEFDIVWIASQVAWPHLAASKGAIVNIGSVAALLGVRSLPETAHSATKGAVIAFTKQLAAEGVALGIRANCICPGVMGTPPVAAMYDELGENSPVQSIVERTITGKPGDPLAVAYAGLYLSSDESSWVTGSTLIVDGGASAII